MQRLFTVTVLMLATVMLAIPGTIGSLSAPPPQPTVEAARPDGSDLIPVNVYFPDRQEIEAIPLGEYLKGVVAGEMPIDFEVEALKAQFVVARTYTVRRMQRFGGKGGCPLNPAADVCADHTVSQAYMTQAQLEAKVGKLAARAFWRTLDQVQEATAGQVLTYRGELIDPLYHSVSGRMTENSADYFVNDLPYLVAVDDRWGAHSPRLVAQKRFDPAQFARALARDGKSPALAVTAATRSGQSPVQITARTETGRVRTVKVGELTYSGREFRERLGLNSSDFRVFLKGGEVVVETFGYGHGVGMSQYGADGMARAGKGYEEILRHYYQGVEMRGLFEG